MGIKSAYRQKSENKSEPAPAAPKVVMTPEVAKGEPPSVVVSVHSGSDDASQRLQAHVAALRQSEQMQRDPREAKLHQWKQHGLSPEDERFLRENPVLIDHDRLTGDVVREVAKHHPPGTDEHREAVKVLFNRLMGDAEKELLAKAAAQRSHQPPPPPTPHPQYTATVGGHAMPNDSSDEPIDPRRVIGRIGFERSGGGHVSGSGKVTLTPEERAFARQLGQSEELYAANKLKIRQSDITRGREEDEYRRR